MARKNWKSLRVTSSTPMLILDACASSELMRRDLAGSYLVDVCVCKGCKGG